MPEPSPEYAAAWARFQALDRLILGPETIESAWAHGRDRYAALLIPVDDPPAVAHIHDVLDRMGDIPGVEPYPEPYWHITIKGIGFVANPGGTSDEVSASHLQTVSRLIAEVLASQPPFVVQAGRINAFAQFRDGVGPGHVFVARYGARPKCPILLDLPASPSHGRSRFQLVHAIEDAPRCRHAIAPEIRAERHGIDAFYHDTRRMQRLELGREP